MLKIAIIIGSTRPGRKGETVGKWAYDIARKRNDAEFELVDIADFNLPFLTSPCRRCSASTAIITHGHGRRRLPHSTGLSLSRLSTTTALAPPSKTRSIFCTRSGPTKRRDSSGMEGLCQVEGRREQFQTAPGKSFSGLLGLQSLDILQEGLLMAFGLDVLVDLAEGTIGVDDKAGAIPVHRTFVLALPHPRRL